MCRLTEEEVDSWNKRWKDTKVKFDLYYVNKNSNTKFYVNSFKKCQRKVQKTKFQQS